KSEGYAEFRDHAVNSISVRAVDRPRQSRLYSNLADFAEARGAWKKLDGTSATIVANYAGAKTSNRVIQFDELGQVTRPGVEGRGVSLDPSALYRVSITMRCVSESSQINIHLPAYDIAGDPLSLVEVTPQFIMEAEAGTDYDAEPYGWQVVTSYVQGQSDTPVPVEDASQFNPIPLPVGTAYVVPTVIHDWFDSTPAISQVDSLII